MLPAESNNLPSSVAFDCVSQCSNKCIKSDYICKFSLYIQCLYWYIIKWTRGLLKTLRISRETGFISLLCLWRLPCLWLSTLWLPYKSLATMYMKEFENLILNCFFKVEYCHLGTAHYLLYRGRLRRNSTVIIFFRWPHLKTGKTRT
jgi:hypothetical protein